MSEELLRDQESQAASFHGELLGFGVIGGLVILLLMKAIQEWRHK